MSRYPMILRAAIAAVVCGGAGCSFDAPAASGPGDDAPPDAPPDEFDAPPDVPIGAGRVTEGLVAYWRFDEGSGAQASDSRAALVGSPALPAIPLPISDPTSVTWVPGGLRLDAPVRVGTSGPAHVSRDVLATGEVTLEAWVSPASASQGAGTLPGGLPDYALVLSVSPSYAYHNAMIAQVGDRWQGRILTSATTSNALPVIETPAGMIADTRPVHLVLVASATDRVLYVNGAPYRAADGAGIGPLNAPAPALRWFDYFPISVGQERDTTTQKRTWLGTVWLAAIYSRALSSDEVRTNFSASRDCPNC
jgi:hypothetical protein